MGSGRHAQPDPPDRDAECQWTRDPLARPFPIKGNQVHALSLPVGLTGHAAAVVAGNLYVVGGSPGCADVSGTLYVYNRVTQTWTTKAPMPTMRTGLAVRDTSTPCSRTMPRPMHGQSFHRCRWPSLLRRPRTSTRDSTSQAGSRRADSWVWSDGSFHHREAVGMAARGEA
ncbi:MAG: hypothetical protein HY650_12190 [Acidobacteria bacterium]|nr:hypothetical protein [Acidobacteriota bacterium]